MRRIFVCSCFLCIAAGLSANASVTKPSLIQTALTASSYHLSYLSDDEFGPEKPNTQDEKKKEPDIKTDASTKKSLVKAIAYSAVIPGAGEWYVGSRTKAKYFFGAEAAIWIGFTSFAVMKHWRHEDMIRYGDSHANAHLDGRSDEFLDLVGFYDSIDEYNSLGRATDPERPYLADTPENHWRWDNEGSMEGFRTIKNQYREANRRGQFMLALAAINRIISIIDVVRDVHRHNANTGTEFSVQPSYKLHVSLHPESNTQVRLTLITPF